MNTIGESSKINTYSVTNENVVALNSATTENKACIDDTAAILSLSEDAFGDGVVTVKSSGTTMSTRTSNQTYQSMLSAMLFYNGPVDGNLTSSVSKKAINNFQKVYGLSQSGSLDSNTASKLNEVYSFYINTLNDSDMTSLKNNLFINNDVSSSLAYTLTDNLALTWTFLRKGMGLSEQQAAGAMGNIMQESYFSPNNAQDTSYSGIQNSNYTYQAGDGVAYGLIQWKHSSRKNNLLTVANSMGLSVSNINAQFACIRDESIKSNYCLTGWNSLRNCGSVSDATRIFKEQVEICGDNTLNDRTNFANIIYNALRTG